jgi:hypothetical protein
MQKKVIDFTAIQGGKEYEISFPNIGQMMDIEQSKLTLTNSRYIDFALSPLNNHVFILDFTDAISYLSNLIPTLKKDLGVEKWGEVQPEMSKAIIRIYKIQFLPWFKPLLDDLYSFNKEEKSEANEQSEA